MKQVKLYLTDNSISYNLTAIKKLASRAHRSLEKLKPTDILSHLKMSFTEEEVRRAADMKLWVEARIAEHEVDIERLRQMLLVLDSILRRSSFRTAAELAPQIKGEPEVKEVKPLKRAKDDELLANAHVSSSSLTIIPVNNVKLTIDTPPFKSFLVNRILEGMRAKDMELVKQGKLNSNLVLTYSVEEHEGVITKLTVSNFRETTRLNEIISTVTWAFTRMLEKK